MSLLAILALLKSRWKEALGVLIALAAVFLWASFRHEVHARKAAEAKAAAAHVEAVVQKAQAGLSDTASQAADRASTQALTITVRAQEASRAIQSAPGASEPVPPSVLAAWAAGIDGVRGGSGCPAADDPAGSGEPSGAVSAPC